nr:hypothetical protein [uncultured bacterium]
MSIEIGQPGKLFNLEEAREHLPLVQAITRKHQAQLAPVQARLSKMLSNDPRRATLEVDYEQVVSRWRGKIEQLGASVHGLWVVEFNVGEGALCWRYPELTLNYLRFHGEAFSSRTKLAVYIEEHDPDWA